MFKIGCKCKNSNLSQLIYFTKPFKKKIRTKTFAVCRSIHFRNFYQLTTSHCQKTLINVFLVFVIPKSGQTFLFTIFVTFCKEFEVRKEQKNQQIKIRVYSFLVTLLAQSSLFCKNIKTTN